jgi:cupin 2 domain-containing protein
MCEILSSDGNLLTDLFKLTTGCDEQFHTLFNGGHIRIERILSNGNITPPDEWYDQSEDEWVLLVAGKAELMFSDGSTCPLKAGDYIMIPAGRKHKVTYTSRPAVWLAIFIQNKSPL